MALHNVTVTLPEDLLREAKHMAVDQGVSLSKFLATLIEERVRSTERYEIARERALRMMRAGFKLGMPDRPTWTREELHER